MKDGQLTRGKNFEESRELKLRNFSKELFAKSFQEVGVANDFAALREALKKGIADLHTQLGK